MFTKLFKKKPLPQEQSYPIQFENQQSQVSTIYTMPKILTINEEKIFNPQNWSLNNFQIGRPLGRGKFGHVYLARQKSMKYIVALKIISKKQIVNSDIINQVRRQIQIHSHLDHENILKMHGFFFDKRKIYYIIQYASGGQLYKQFRAKKRYPQQISSSYMKQMVKAIQYLHQLDIIHRDIKPQNIMICHQDNKQILKLTDFGWSIHAPTTKRKTMCGTIDYLSPQLIQHKSHDKNVDIWGLGVLAYQLTAGFAPFESQTKGKTFDKIKRVDYKFPTSFSQQLRDFLRRIFKKNPLQRISTQQMLEHPWIANSK